MQHLPLRIAAEQKEFEEVTRPARNSAVREKKLGSKSSIGAILTGASAATGVVVEVPPGSPVGPVTVRRGF
jgi:hypothetical protein